MVSFEPGRIEPPVNVWPLRLFLKPKSVDLKHFVVKLKFSRCVLIFMELLIFTYAH